MLARTHHDGGRQMLNDHNCGGRCLTTTGPLSISRLEKLFDKVITNSDIKLCRLALPKLQVKKHFPAPLHEEAAAAGGTLVCMQDGEGKTWRFRLTFWKSSQGYVFTSEWNQFVREKGLKAGDVICFLQSNSPDDEDNKKLHIDWKPSQGGEGCAAANGDHQELTTNNNKAAAAAANHHHHHHHQQGQPFKLFGVRIPTT